MSSQSHMIEPEELMAYLDGELSPEHALEIASHLENCRECQKLADGFRSLSRELLEWQLEPDSFEIAPRVVEALDADEGKAPRDQQQVLRLRPRSRSKLLLLWAGAIGSMAVVLLLIALPHTFLAHKAAPAARTKESEARMQSFLGPAKSESSAPALADRSEDLAASKSATYYSYDSLNQLTPAPPPPPPPATAVGGPVGNAGTGGKLEGGPSNGNMETSTFPNGPMIVRTVDLVLTARDFNQVRSSLDEILKRHHGYLGELNVSTPSGSARSLTAALRIPSAQLESALADLKSLGRVEREAQNGEEVTQQYVDLEARLKNARNTENRLTELQRERRGKLSDVLAVEKEISRVRGEIEEMEAQRKTLRNQIDFATLNLTVAEDYKADLKVVPPSIGTQIRNAAVDGYRSVVDGLFGLLLWLLSWLPTLLIWALVLFYPARMAWRKLRPRLAQKTSEL